MKPIASLFFVTLRCNAYCEFCRIWRDQSFQIPEEEEVPFNRQQLLKLFGDLRRLGVRYLEITGGEPLLRDDLPILLDAAKTRGLFVHLSTNGFLLSEKISELVGKVDRLTISMDSPVPADHDRSRGIEMFDLVLDGIAAAKAAKLNLQISYTVTKDSILQLPELEEFLEKHKLLAWLNPVYDFYGFEKLSAESVEHLKYFLKKPRFLGNLAAFKLIPNGNRVARPLCKAAESVVTILPDMTLALPCFFTRQKRIKIENDLFSLWKSKEKLAAHQSQGRLTNCEGCMAWPYMLTSFWYRLNRLFWLNLYSNLDLMYKEYRAKREES
jgi:MoaA/NifB/PqqE/SkfB family radical SAM enzyme